MRKNIILLLSFLLVTIVAKSEDFYVLHIKGHIVVNEQGTELKLGDKLTNQDKVMFVGKESVAVVMSSTRGRLRLENKKQSNLSEFTYIVNSFSSPSHGTLSTRGGNDIYSVKDLKEHVKGETYPIINKRTISIPRQLPTNDGSYYYFKYEINGQKVSKRFTKMEETIIIDSSIYQIADSTINSSNTQNSFFCYYSASSKQELPIVAFNPVFIDKDQLIKEMVTFTQIQQTLNTSRDISFEEIFTFVQEVYGNIDRPQLKDIYQKEIQTK